MSKHDAYELVPAPIGRKIVWWVGKYFQDQGIPDDQIRNGGPGICFFDFMNAGVCDRLKATLYITQETISTQFCSGTGLSTADR